MSNNAFIRMIYAFLKEHNVDTSGMSPQEAIDEYERLNGDTAPEESNDNAAESVGKKISNDAVTLPKQEYAALCSAIRTKYGDKIPSKGDAFYGNRYYRFHYSKENEKIVCVLRMEIVGNEKFITHLRKV